MSATALSAALRAAYLRLLERRFGLRHDARAADQVERGVMGLLSSSSYTRPAELYTALAGGLHPDMLEALATSMTVAETHFFRVTPQIQALRDVVLPDLIARHSTDRRLRLWSAGCSTGEEAYTLAMLVCEQLGRPQDWDIKLLGTDLNRASLEVARLAVYGEWSFRDSPLEVRARYFTSTANQWRLHDQVRGMVRFGYLNLADASFCCPFGSNGELVDLILCRNVTIYFVEAASQRLYHHLARTMAPDAWLVLGPSDPAPRLTTALELILLNGAILWRRRNVARHVQAPKHLAPARRPAGPRRLPSSRRAETPGPAGPSMDPRVHLHDGMVRLGEGAPASAIDSLRRAAFLDETSALVQFSLGRAYRQIGDPSRSRSAFSRARRLLAGQPDDQPLADAELATGELRHAVEAQLADLDRARP